MKYLSCHSSRSQHHASWPKSVHFSSRKLTPSASHRLGFPDRWNLEPDHTEADSSGRKMTLEMLNLLSNGQEERGMCHAEWGRHTEHGLVVIYLVNREEGAPNSPISGLCSHTHYGPGTPCLTLWDLCIHLLIDSSSQIIKPVLQPKSTCILQI